MRKIPICAKCFWNYHWGWEQGRGKSWFDVFIEKI